MMSKELKAKWLAALRSGEYTQGKEALRNENDCFCCLGVLADICETPEYEWQKINSMREYRFGLKDGKGDSGFLPDALAVELLVAPGQDEYLSDEHVANDFMDRVARKNDSGESFTEIAEWLEENLHA